MNYHHSQGEIFAAGLSKPVHPDDAETIVRSWRHEIPRLIMLGRRETADAMAHDALSLGEALLAAREYNRVWESTRAMLRRVRSQA